MQSVESTSRSSMHASEYHRRCTTIGPLASRQPGKCRHTYVGACDISSGKSSHLRICECNEFCLLPSSFSRIILRRKCFSTFIDQREAGSTSIERKLTRTTTSFIACGSMTVESSWLPSLPLLYTHFTDNVFIAFFLPHYMFVSLESI
uniref:Hydrophobin n=1 Tax=Parascaris univalens TaxID=6257 RepID=A0A914ZS79_PARUN